MDPADAEAFRKLKFKTAEQEEIKNSLQILMRMMHVHIGKPVILLIDEYDVPLAKANEEKEAGEHIYGCKYFFFLQCAGQGVFRYITLTDKKMRRALVIEAKKSGSEKQMESDCIDALDQIPDKKYAQGLKGYRQIICYGIAFFRKSALVKKTDNTL